MSRNLPSLPLGSGTGRLTPSFCQNIWLTTYFMSSMSFSRGFLPPTRARTWGAQIREAKHGHVSMWVLESTAWSLGSAFFYPTRTTIQVFFISPELVFHLFFFFINWVALKAHAFFPLLSKARYCFQETDWWTMLWVLQYGNLITREDDENIKWFVLYP